VLIMNFVVAPDSFKGTLTQVEAARIMKEAIVQKHTDAKVTMKPMADGGEGTLDTLLASIPNSKKISCEVTGPLGKKIKTNIGVINDETVVIEIATIVGLPLLPDYLKNPYQTTTYGVGEVIKFALDQSYRKFIIGLGGSATNDGGLGMLLALGASIKTKDGTPVGIFGADLLDVHTINLDTLDHRLKQATFIIASDVANELLGDNGATYVFGPQKGLKQEQLCEMDVAMAKFAHTLEQASGITDSKIYRKGSGSAGGLGFAYLVLGARYTSGAQLIAATINLEQSISEANLVITGEGKSDHQTINGKAPGYVAELANKYNVPVILVSGRVDKQSILDQYFTASYQLIDETVDLHQAMKQPRASLLRKMKQVIANI